MEHAGNERENKKDNGSRGKTGRPKTAYSILIFTVKSLRRKTKEKYC